MAEHGSTGTSETIPPFSWGGGRAFLQKKKTCLTGSPRIETKRVVRSRLMHGGRIRWYRYVSKHPAVQRGGGRYTDYLALGSRSIFLPQESTVGETPLRWLLADRTNRSSFQSACDDRPVLLLGRNPLFQEELEGFKTIAKKKNAANFALLVVHVFCVSLIMYPYILSPTSSIHCCCALAPFPVHWCTCSSFFYSRQ